MTLADIELDVFRRLDYADTPPVSVKNRIDSFINQRHRQILSHDRMRPLRHSTYTLPSIANTSNYILPDYIARVTRVLDRDSDYELPARTVEWYMEHYPDPAAETGTPEFWVQIQVASDEPGIIALGPTPGGVSQYQIHYEAAIPPLLLPADVPTLPEEFHDLLCSYARLDEYEYKSDTRWEALMMQIQARLKELRAFVDNHDVYKRHAVPDYRPRPWNRAGA